MMEQTISTGEKVGGMVDLLLERSLDITDKAELRKLQETSFHPHGNIAAVVYWDDSISYQGLEQITLSVRFTSLSAKEDGE